MSHNVTFIFHFYIIPNLVFPLMKNTINLIKNSCEKGKYQILIKKRNLIVFYIHIEKE